MNRTLRLACLSALTLLLCTACFGADRTGATTQDPPLAEPTPASTYTPSHSVGGGPQAPETSAPTNPQWLPGDEETAKGVAVNAMRDFARPELDETLWANDFARWLTPKATTAYSSVDSANVPVTEVTGPATLEVEEANGFGATATVPTDIGDYRVQLLRQGQDEPWKVNRLYPPDSANQPPHDK